MAIGDSVDSIINNINASVTGKPTISSADTGLEGIVDYVPPTVSEPASPNETAPVTDNAAYDQMKQMLEDYGLPVSLLDEIKEYVSKNFTVDQMIYRLRQTDEFKERFKGMDQRLENGLNAISIDEYITLERNYANVLAEFGLPKSFYDSPDDFANFIGNDVSAEEFAARTALAAQAVSNIDPNLQDELRRLYPEIGDGDMIAYFLDPERGVTLMEQKVQMTAAGLSSAAVDTVGQGFSASVAEELASRNVQPIQIGSALSPQAGLTQSTLSSEGVSTDTLASSAFGLDAGDANLVRRMRQRRQQTRQSGSGGLLQQTGVTGLGSTQMS